MKDHYQTLGVSRDASHDEVKKAFRKLAHEHHPDKKGGDEAKFKEINEAYSVLGDPEKRKRYDTFGSTDGPAGGGGFGGGQGFGGFDFSGFSQGFGGRNDMEFDLGDVFSSFFGGDGGKRRRGKDIRVILEMGFKDAVFGSKQHIAFHAPASCKDCAGQGSQPGSGRTKCTACDGKGKRSAMKQSILGSIRTTVTCETCHGVGTVPEKPCATCKGSGVLKRQVEHDVDIPAGTSDGDQFVIRGAGEAITGGPAGDLHVIVRVKGDKRFRRDGDDLIVDAEIPLSTSLVGGTITIDALDGTVAAEVKPCSRHGDDVVVRGRGVPTGKSRGDLIVRLSVRMPKKPSSAVKDLAKELEREGN